MKKGFTLIELLAVIVILAIIALIAIPTITNIADKINIKIFILCCSTNIKMKNVCML